LLTHRGHDTTLVPKSSTATVLAGWHDFKSEIDGRAVTDRPFSGLICVSQRA
jgi:hypothetical protein